MSMTLRQLESVPALAAEPAVREIAVAAISKLRHLADGSGATVAGLVGYAVKHAQARGTRPIDELAVLVETLSDLFACSVETTHFVRRNHGPMAAI